MESTLESIKKMIYELTLAVYNSKLQGESYSKPINKTIMYIRNNYTQNISLDTLAFTVGYSAPHLPKEFKKEVGITISDYIQRLRCNKAAEMLKETDTSIADISFYVGYPDNNYFTKVFKKYFGVTPTVHRNTNS